MTLTEADRPTDQIAGESESGGSKVIKTDEDGAVIIVEVD